jgi:hypothetical protein
LGAWNSEAGPDEPPNEFKKGGHEWLPLRRKESLLASACIDRDTRPLRKQLKNLEAKNAVQRNGSFPSV